MTPIGVDYRRVTVAIGGARATTLGTADVALRDPRITAAERAAIEALVQAVALLRGQAGQAGIDDAGRGVTLVFRDAEAGRRGPWATDGEIRVGTRNVLALRMAWADATDVLLPVDAAVHELTHVVQFGRIGAGVTPSESLLEGVADAVAMLATGDDLLGEDFWRRSAVDAPARAIRAIGADGAELVRRGVEVLAHTSLTVGDAAGAEAHAAGGVASAAIQRIRDELGPTAAMRLIWAVIRDRAAWRTGGSWASFAASLRHAAEGAVELRAVDDALRATGLDRA